MSSLFFFFAKNNTFFILEVSCVPLYIHTHTHILDTSHRMFTNDPGDLSSIPGRVILKTLKMVLDLLA